MMGSINCVYETPCGWCSKWDKKCDRKLPEQKTKSNLADDFDTVKAIHANKLCSSESEHEWECCGVSTTGTNYRCKKCGAHKSYPMNTHDVTITF